MSQAPISVKFLDLNFSKVSLSLYIRMMYLVETVLQILIFPRLPACNMILLRTVGSSSKLHHSSCGPPDYNEND